MDTDDLEALAASLEESGDYRILRRVPTVAHYAEPPDGIELRRGLIVDVETTGLAPKRDTIIEFAMLPFDFSSDGGLYAVHEGYAGFEDPGAPLPELVTRLTGITDDDVRGQQLDAETVAGMAEEAALVIAHNAASTAASWSVAFRSSSTSRGAAPLSRCPGPRKACAAGASITSSTASAGSSPAIA